MFGFEHAFWIYESVHEHEFAGDGERKDRLEGPDSASGPYALIWRSLTLEI